VRDRKHVKLIQNRNLEKAIYKWFVQQRSSGVAVRSVELRTAAEKLARRMGIASGQSGKKQRQYLVMRIKYDLSII
jgi:hypothetical protein